MVVHVGQGPDAPAQSPSTTPRACAPRAVTVGLNPPGVRLVRARVRIDGLAVQPTHRGTRWTAAFSLHGTPGQRVTVRISGRREDGWLVRRTRTLTVC